MRANVLVGCVAAVLVSGCGSSSSPAAAPPPGSPSPDPGSSPTTAAPSPAPSPSPGPAPGSPTPAPSPAPSPSPSPSPAPQPDRFVDLERLDANPECDGLLPATVPAPVTASTTDSGPGGCGRGVSDGTGHVAASVQFGRGNLWQAFGPDGSVERRFGATSDAFPQPEGWQGLLGMNGSTSFTLTTYFGDGSPRRSETPQPAGYSPRIASIAQDPAGGTALAMVGPASGGGCAGDLRRFDATGAPSGTPAPLDCGSFATFAVGVSTGGEALVVQQAGGSSPVRWIRTDGSVAASGTDPNASNGALLPLLDGSIVVQSGASYLRRYPHLATASEAAPAWLSARTGQAYRFTRGNRGYAFFPAAGQNSPDCTQVVELVAPSGRRCAKLTFRRDGNACMTGAIDQGWDGTVVEQASSGACGWRIWPGLLAGG